MTQCRYCYMFDKIGNGNGYCFNRKITTKKMGDKHYQIVNENDECENGETNYQLIADDYRSNNASASK